MARNVISRQTPDFHFMALQFRRVINRYEIRDVNRPIKEEMHME